MANNGTCSTGPGMIQEGLCCTEQALKGLALSTCHHAFSQAPEMRQ